MVDPQELIALGQAMNVRAGAVTEVRDRLRASVSGATWEGAAAARIDFAAQQLTRHIALHGDDLSSLALQLRRLADALTQEINELRGIEQQVRAWIGANPNIAPPWPATALPAPGDPSWRQVQKAFNAAGIPITAAPVAAPAVAPVPVAAPAAAPVTGDPSDWKSTLTPAESWIIQHESDFNPNAVNPSSGAFGIWQGLGSTLTTYAHRFGFDTHTTDPHQQLTMFRAYVKDRYGTAENAMAFWQKHHWY